VVAAVLGVLEVQDGGPVVGEILGHLARSAGSPLAYITVHGDVEGIAADDVMHVSRGERARLAGGIQTLERQGRAREAEAGVDRGAEEHRGCGEQLHVDGALGLSQVVER